MSNKEAGAQALKGEDRKKFMSECHSLADHAFSPGQPVSESGRFCQAEVTPRGNRRRSVLVVAYALSSARGFAVTSSDSRLTRLTWPGAYF